MRSQSSTNPRINYSLNHLIDITGDLTKIENLLIIPEIIKNILTIPKGNKTKEDLIILSEYFMNFLFFNSGIEIYGKNTLINLLDSCTLLELDKNHTIINIGDTVKSAYILINGEIKISSHNQINKFNKDELHDKLEASQKLNKSLNMCLYKTVKHLKYDLDSNLESSVKNQNNLKYMKYKCHKPSNIEDDWYVKIGEMFGDKCLIERKTSALSFKTCKNSYLLEIKRKDFYSLVEPVRKEEYIKDLKFFHSISVFSEFSRNAIERLKLNIDEKKYFNGEIVVEQNKIIDQIYIVRSGSFQVTYRSKKNILNEFDLNYYTNITPLDFRFTENCKHEIKGYKKTEENLKLFTVEKGQFIGDLEFIHKREKSYFMVTCLQKDSVLISLPRYAFEKYVKGQEEEFKEFTKEREIYYKNRFKKLTEISKSFCFDNPESRHLNNLINRIKDGMELIRIQEQNLNGTSMANKGLYSKSPSELEKRNILNHNNIKKQHQKDFKNSKNFEVDFLKDYNRSGTFNEKFKKNKKKILKKKTSDTLIKYKDEDNNKDRNKKDYRDQAIHSNENKAENIQKLNKMENNNLIDNKKKQNNLYSKGKSIRIGNNINNFDVKYISKFEKKKMIKSQESQFPRKL